MNCNTTHYRANSSSVPGDPTLQPGETFAALLGVYRQEGIYSVPLTHTYFSGRERMPLEVLDWGEVWAMQAYMRDIMPRPQTPDYYMAYWGMAESGKLGAISRKQQQGKTLTTEEQAMVRHFGAQPSFRDQELWYRLTPETVPYYRRVIDDAARLGHFQTLVEPGMLSGHRGWFESPEQKRDAPAAALTDKWFERPAYPLWKELADYAASKQMGMSTLELAGRGYRQDRPEWKYTGADGKRSGSNCYGNRRYAEWYTMQVDHALSMHPIRHWQWDEGWMDGVRGTIGEDAYCYA